MLVFSDIRPKTAFVGETVHLHCGSDEIVIPRVDWLYRPSPDVTAHFIISAGNPVNGDFNGRSNINGTTLIINNVQEEDSGMFICVEDTRFRIEHRVNLTVQGKLSD